MDQIREPDRIQCLECGRWMRALPTHLRKAHGWSDEDYRLKFGIPVGVPLVCLEWSENQGRRNIERDTQRTLTARGPKPGFKQRESAKANRREQYLQNAAKARAVSHAKDRTAHRREMLQPYPVTVAQAAERLGCTRAAAYTFLSYCVAQGRLQRTGRGLYDETKKRAAREDRVEEIRETKS